MRLPTARTTMLALIAAAALPVWRACAMMPGFLDIDSPLLLSDNAPNLWAIVQALPLIGSLQFTGLAMAAAIGAGVTFAAKWIARPPRPSETFAAALLVALTLPGLLPGMAWTDFIPASLCAILLLAHCKDRPSQRIAALTLAGTILAATGLATLGAPAMIVATLLVARQFLVSPANDNGLPLNPFRVYPA